MDEQPLIGLIRRNDLAIVETVDGCGDVKRFRGEIRWRLDDELVRSHGYIGFRAIRNQQLSEKLQFVWLENSSISTQIFKIQTATRLLALR